MKILFLTLLKFSSLKERNIYTDLLRKFTVQGHDVYVISPLEKREAQATHLLKEHHCEILRLKIGNIQKTGKIEKGISTLTLERRYTWGIKKYFPEVKFDLLLYSTPPITFQKAVEFVKKRDNCKTYLLLKDIFPQNAVDMGMISVTGIKGELYRYFRNKEKKLYQISDFIGCMSQANVDYLIGHNPQIDPDKVHIHPNCIDVDALESARDERTLLRCKYNLPVDKLVFVYGGNLGRPQGIDFLISCLERQRDNDAVFFLIVGAGTEYHKLKKYVDGRPGGNVLLLESVSKEEYDNMIACCDVGMIFLDHRFTIPNFPSRLLSYMQAGIPVLAATDSNTDIGLAIQEGGFGAWCESSSTDGFVKCVEQFYDMGQNRRMGENAVRYLKKNYSSEKGYQIIMDVLKNTRKEEQL